MKAIQFGVVGAVVSMLAVVGCAEVPDSDIDDGATGSQEADLVRKPSPCKGLPKPEIGCKDGQPKFTCDTSDKKPSWRVTCPGTPPPPPPKECTPSECGPQPMMAAIQCDDGTYPPDAVCKRNDAGTCGWVFPSCDANTGPFGLWGGRSIQLDLEKTGTKVTFDCAVGMISAFTLDASGSFRATGTYVPGKGVEKDKPAPIVKATYWGSISGKTMKLYVAVEGSPDAAVFELTYGTPGQIVSCQ